MLKDQVSTFWGGFLKAQLSFWPVFATGHPMEPKDRWINLSLGPFTAGSEDSLKEVALRKGPVFLKGTPGKGVLHRLRTKGCTTGRVGLVVVGNHVSHFWPSCG